MFTLLVSITAVSSILYLVDVVSIGLTNESLLDKIGNSIMKKVSAPLTKKKTLAEIEREMYANYQEVQDTKEKEYNDNARYLQSIAKVLPTGVYIKDDSGKLRFYNEQDEEITNKAEITEILSTTNVEDGELISYESLYVYGKEEQEETKQVENKMYKIE